MIRIFPGVRPRSRNSVAARQRGFSVVELMISVLLVAIGAALALPSYRDMVEKRQVTNGAEQIASFINTAQGLAMKTNRVVTVSYWRNDDDEWCIGATDAAAACDCNETVSTEADFCQVSTQPLTMNNSHANDLELMHNISGDGAYAFDPVRGLFRDMNDSLTMEMRSPGGDFRLNLVVNNTGRVILCSDSSSHAVPGYAVCPQPAVEGG